MKQYAFILFIGVVALSVVDCRTLEKRDAIDPLENAEDLGNVYRDRRAVDGKYGIKNAILGFVFNPSKGASTVRKPSTQKPSTTTEDIVIFEKDKPVSVEVDDRLIGSSFTLVTNLSTSVGDFMMNSALRAQRLLESMRPFLRFVFGAKGVVIEATTDKPIFSEQTTST